MSYTVALSTPSFAIVATDTRVTRYMADGSEEYRETDGKLAQMDGGWVAGTGEPQTLAHGIEALRGRGVEDLSEVSRALRGAYDRTTDGIRERFSDSGKHIRKHRFVLARDAGGRFHLHHLRADGTVDRTAEQWEFLITTPSGLTEPERQEVCGAITAGLSATSTVLDLITNAARGLARTAELSGRVSRELRAGASVRRPYTVTHYHLAADVDAVLAHGPGKYLNHATPGKEIAA